MGLALCSGLSGAVIGFLGDSHDKLPSFYPGSCGGFSGSRGSPYKQVSLALPLYTLAKASRVAVAHAVLPGEFHTVRAWLMLIQNDCAAAHIRSLGVSLHYLA